VSERLFLESHLWTYALGREMSLRAKGLVGSVDEKIQNFFMLRP